MKEHRWSFGAIIENKVLELVRDVFPVWCRLVSKGRCMFSMTGQAKDAKPDQGFNDALKQFSALGTCFLKALYVCNQLSKPQGGLDCYLHCL